MEELEKRIVKTVLDGQRRQLRNGEFYGGFTWLFSRTDADTKAIAEAKRYVFGMINKLQDASVEDVSELLKDHYKVFMCPQIGPKPNPWRYKPLMRWRWADESIPAWVLYFDIDGDSQMLLTRS